MELFLFFPYIKGGLAAKKEFTISPSPAEKACFSTFLDLLIYVGLLAELGDIRVCPCDIHGI